MTIFKSDVFTEHYNSLCYAHVELDWNLAKEKTDTFKCRLLNFSSCYLHNIVLLQLVSSIYLPVLSWTGTVCVVVFKKIF